MTLESGMMIEIINQRATMLANPRRFRTPWDKAMQTDFTTILLFFDKATPEEWDRFERDTDNSTPERQTWERINRAYIERKRR